MLELTCRSAYEAYWAFRVNELERENNALKLENDRVCAICLEQERDIFYLEKSCELYHGAITAWHAIL